MKAMVEKSTPRRGGGAGAAASESAHDRIYAHVALSSVRAAVPVRGQLHSGSLTARRPFMIPPSQLSSLPTYASSSASRLKTLYSDFSRQKQSNPTSYASNIEWWRRTLEVIVLKGWLAESDSKSTHPDRLVLRASGSTLADNFRYEGVGKPLGLPTVVVCHQPSSPYDVAHH